MAKAIIYQGEVKMPDRWHPFTKAYKLRGTEGSRAICKGTWKKAHEELVLTSSEYGFIFQRKSFSIKIYSVVVGRWSHRDDPSDREYSH